jgi:Putative transposase
LTFRGEALWLAISNRRLISFDRAGVTFKWKDYRAKGHQRAKVSAPRS